MATQVTVKDRSATSSARGGSHVIGVSAGLVLTPLGVTCLAGGVYATATAHAQGQPATIAATAAVLAGAALLGVVAATNATSASGALVGGTLCCLAPGLAYFTFPDTFDRWASAMFEPVAAVGGDQVVAGLAWLGRSASLLLIGLTLVLLSGAATIARRAGRAGVRSEIGRYHRSPSARPVNARSTPGLQTRRRLDHVLSLSMGLILTPLAVVLAAAASATFTTTTDAGAPTGSSVLLTSGLIAAALLVAVVVGSSLSTLGLFTGAVVFGLVPGALGLASVDWVHHGVGGFLARIGTALDPQAVTGLHDMTTLGVLLAWGAVGALGALGVHAARRDGKRRELVELAGAARRTPAAL